jgi:type II secretion system protein H
MKPRASQRAFTLLELVLVLLIISTVVAAAAPSLRNWNRGARLRDATDELLATTRLARSQAAATARLHRLNIDPQAGRYWLTMQDGQQFVAAERDAGRVVMLPPGVRLELTSSTANQSWIDFHPTGRIDPATLRLSDDMGFSAQLECPSPAEGFRLVRDEAR